MKRSARHIFDQYLQENGIRRSKPREQVFDIFINTEKHLTVLKLYELTKARYPNIGYATVYRAMKIICDAGIADEINFGGLKHYEHKYGHEHHDHMICTECKELIEVLNPEIEEMQQALAQAYDFTITNHRLQIFGVCGKCKKEQG